MNTPGTDASFGVLAVLLICICSGLAGVYSEKVIKESPKRHLSGSVMSSYLCMLWSQLCSLELSSWMESTLPSTDFGKATIGWWRCPS